MEDHGVQVGELVRLGGDILLQEVVLALVVEDQVHLLGGATADIGTEHDTETLVRRAPKGYIIKEWHTCIQSHR